MIWGERRARGKDGMKWCEVRINRGIRGAGEAELERERGKSLREWNEAGKISYESGDSQNGEMGRSVEAQQK